MAYLAPIHGPSSVRHSIKLRLSGAENECLVLAKANILEIYDQTANGLVRRHSRAVYGKITMLQKLRAENLDPDHLFVGTDRHAYFTLSWDVAAKQFHTEHILVDQAEKSGRDSQTVDRCLVDPFERFMALNLFEGVTTIVPLTRKGKKKADPETKELGHPVPVRISELFVRSSAYLHPRGKTPRTEKPTLAMIYEDNQQNVRVKIKTLDYAPMQGEAELSDHSDMLETLDVSSSHIVPVPGPVFGFLVLAETSITYVDETAVDCFNMIPLPEATIWVAWEQVDDKRWLLADDYGELYFLMILLGGADGSEFEGIKLDPIGSTSRASVMTYLDDGDVFVGSHLGNSQVVKIQEHGVEVLQTIANIAPILDFTVMDMGSRSGDGQTNEYSSGQARIVTGSGAFQDGSLRSVRSGVGIEDFGSLGDYGHVTDLFPLQSSPVSKVSNVLMISLIDETRILQFAPDGEAEEIDSFMGLDLREEGTLLAANISGGRLLHCTSSILKIIDLNSGLVNNDWSPDSGGKIVAASANSQCAVLSVSGVDLVALDFTDANELKLVSVRKFGTQNQISCIDVPSILPGVCILGFWQSAHISILRLETLEEIYSSKVSEDAAAVPRSVLLTQILHDRPPTLLVALADGNVITYDVAPTYELSGKKSTILGTQPANFRPLPREDGKFHVFATCEHPSLIYGSEGRLVYSAVTADKASCICPFDSEGYKGAIIIATPDEIKISLVGTERTTHIQTLPIGETVRRIAYSTNARAFGLGTIKRTLKEGVEIVQSHFKLADEVVFKELDSYQFHEDELVESVLRADLMEGPRGVVERFIVGTAYLDDDDPDAIRGRIIVFEVTQDRTLKVVAERAIKGACRALDVIDGKIVAALIKTVVIFAFNAGELTRVASYRTSTAPIDISVTGNLIAVADIMKSLSIVKYTPGTEGLPDKLTEVARHLDIAWTTAVAHVDENTYLESDAEGNIMVMCQNVNGVTEDDKRRLEITSEIQLGEMVNRIRRINVSPTANATVIPRAFMATVDGSIYLFGIINPDKQDFLMTLQSNIAANVKNLGDIDFMQYRAFRNTVREAPEPFRFVDGELVERFLDCSPEMQEKIVKDLGVSVEEVKIVVEGLRRLH